jgi:hypothetical protein
LASQPSKQPVLKPQDIVVTIKIALNRHEKWTILSLSKKLFISQSEVHSALNRAQRSQLVNVEQGRSVAISAALHEFIIYGLKYAFPATLGMIGRGLPTGTSAFADFEQGFVQTDGLPLIWPDATGTEKGITIIPLYSSVPKAAREDDRLYRALALIDCIRAGAAREREFAEAKLRELI